MRRIAAGVAAVALLGACSSPQTVQTDEAPESEVTACQLSDERGLIDYGLNAAVAGGMAEATKTIGADVVQVESANPADYVADLASLSAQGCDIVVGVGSDLREPFQAEATLVTDRKFVLVDGAFVGEDGKLATLENAKSVQFDAAQGGYLAGYLAAGLSTSGKVAVLGGTPTPSTKAAMDGFADGVAGYNATNQAQVAVLGWDKAAQQGTFAGSAVDSTRGQSAAAPLIEQGADVVMPVGGPFGLGAMRAAEANDKVAVLWFGALASDLPEPHDLVAGSIVLDAKPVVRTAIQQTADAEFDNEPYLGTVENKGIVLHTDADRVKAAPNDLDAQLKDVTKRLSNGELKVETASPPAA